MPLPPNRTPLASPRLLRLSVHSNNRTEAEYRRRLEHLLQRSNRIYLKPIPTSTLVSLLYPLVRDIHLQLHHLHLSHPAEMPSHLRTSQPANGATLTELRCLRAAISKAQVASPLHNLHCLLYLLGMFLMAILASHLPAHTALVLFRRLLILTTLFRLRLARQDLHRRNIHHNA